MIAPQFFLAFVMLSSATATAESVERFRAKISSVGPTLNYRDERLAISVSYRRISFTEAHSPDRSARIPKSRSFTITQFLSSNTLEYVKTVALESTVGTNQVVDVEVVNANQIKSIAPIKVERSIAVVESVGPIETLGNATSRKISFHSGRTPFVNPLDWQNGKFTRTLNIKVEDPGTFSSVSDNDNPAVGTTVFLEVIDSNSILTMKKDAIIPISVTGRTRVKKNGVVQILGSIFSPVLFQWRSSQPKYDSFDIAAYGFRQPFGKYISIPLDYISPYFSSRYFGGRETLFVIGYDATGRVTGLGSLTFELH